MSSRHAAALLFLSALAQLALCLYEAVCRSGRARRGADAALFLALVLATGYASALPDGSPLPAGLPVLCCLALLRAGLEMRRTYLARRETLSPASIKEALDRLDSGVLFADAAGRAVLVNYTMGRLAETLAGSYPQTLGELDGALEASRAGRGVEKLSGVPALYRFPDGRIWRFRTVALTDASLPGFTQTTAQDVTELYEANVRLETENAALREAIGKTRRMMERIADRIREQETLNLKTRIHNDIGTSLIALSEMARGGARDDLGRQMETLRLSVSCFSRNRAGLPEALEDVYRLAVGMGVSLHVEGYLPQNQTVEQLVAAAAGVCVTNCVRHAKGRTVTLRLSERRDVCTAEFTNDGEEPRGPIAEGDGLSTLRRRVERAGGEMHVSHAPRFLLLLDLPEKEPEP
ncbi:MAG: hypothetical protein IJ705_02465 [Oscillospiraceae bacterium]|nr:hypothetical protein [Oscillospiraceae bacterium]